MSRDLTDFIAGLPKAELHVHHVGSASARIVGELAERHPGVVPSDPDELRDFFAFRDFAHFVEVYLSVVDLIRTPEDIRYLTYEVAREMAEGQRIRYAELTCTPYTSVAARHPDRGLHRGDRGRADRGGAGLRPGAALDLRHPGGERPAGGRRHAGVRARPPRRRAGRASASADRRSACRGAQFQPHFDAARAAGLHSVPHAGETTGPETVWDALRLLGAERIGHGTSAAQDPALLAHLAETGISLEVCPSSNVATRAVASLEEHPLRGFVEAGVTVTINSDDPPMFGTTLNQEYAVAADLLDLDEAGLRRPGARPPSARRSRRTTCGPGCSRRSTALDHVSSMEDN